MKVLAKNLWIGYSVGLLALLLVVLLPLFIAYSAGIPGIFASVLVAFIYSLGLYGFISNKAFLSWRAWRIIFRVLAFSIGLGCVWFLGFGKIKGVENAIFCLCFVPLAYALREYSAYDNPVWRQEARFDRASSKATKSSIPVRAAKGFVSCISYVALFFMVFYPMLRWDYYVSQYLFEQLCNDETKIGLFVYEHVELGESEIIRAPVKEYERRKIGGEENSPYKISEGVFADPDALSEKFEVTLLRYKYEKVNSIGPMYTRKSLVTRKSDGKLLGEAVTGTNSMGWANRTLHIGHYTGQTCKRGVIKRGGWGTGEYHRKLISSLFYVKLDKEFSHDNQSMKYTTLRY